MRAKRSEAWMDRQRNKFERGFTTLEAMLGGRRWCVGDEMTLADISIACHLGFINLRVPYFPSGQVSWTRPFMEKHGRT